MYGDLSSCILAQNLTWRGWNITKSQIRTVWLRGEEGRQAYQDQNEQSTHVGLEIA